jgi:2-methylisocitrate lyase-like PEP mutase family enzyme
MEEMCGKVEAAAAARDETDPELVIKARTDAAETHGIDEAIRRMNAYVERGADMVFADAILKEENLRRVCEEVDAPVTVNMGYGIRERPTTPLIPAKRLEEWGVSMISYPRLITGSAVKGIQQALAALQDATEAEEVQTSPELTVGFEEYTDLMGLPEIQALEDRFARE